MPCATVHLLTAGRTLARWRHRPADAPFDVDNAPLVDDFLAGTMAPDIGFVPGVPRLMSELAHYVRTGTLVQALLAQARTPGERAFAWGWATHHLTDVIIHPMVGRAVGEVLFGDRDRRVNASENEEVHVSVEVGLDILILHGDEGIPGPVVRQELQGGGLAFLARALTRTYGIPWDTQRLAGDYRLASRQIQAWPRLLRSLGRAWALPPREGRRRGRLGSVAFTGLSSLTSEGSALRGFMRPRLPPTWLPKGVWDVAAEFPDRFQELVASGGARLENRNLETGLLEEQPADHPNTERAREALHRLEKAGSAAEPVPTALPARQSTH